MGERVKREGSALPPFNRHGQKASRERPTRTLTSFRVPAIRIATGHTSSPRPIFR